MKICFVSAPNPKESGGIGIYVRHLIENLQQDKNNEITLIYRGENNKRYKKGDVKYIEIKVPFPKRIIYSFAREFAFNERVRRILNENNFDIINSHATWGYWMKNYKKKKKNQKIIHTYHGVTRNFFKTHLQRFKGIKKILYSPSLIYGKIIEKPPMKRADRVICVSEKVKKQLKKLYGKRGGMEVLRTGVDLKDFKIRDKNKVKKQLNLNPKTNYALYIGSGSGWNKGLDRAINVSREIHKLNKNYKLILIGPNYKNIKEVIKEPFITFLANVPREKIHLYFNASNIVFCLSRYEGGDPTLVVSEAMGSGAVVVCSKSSHQEIIQNNKNGLVINEFGKKDAKNILDLIKNKYKKEKITKNAMKRVKELSLEKWTKKYFEILGIK